MRSVSSAEFLRLSRRVNEIKELGQAYAPPGKNYIINGNFDIWQRGVSQSSSGYGSDDRWINEHNGSTKVHSRQEFAVGQTQVPNNPKFYSRTIVTAGTGSLDYCLKAQSIEDVRTLAGETVVLSFWAKADASRNLSIEVYQYAGAGGSTIDKRFTQKISVTSTWQKFEMSFELSSLNGVLIGVNSFVRLNYWFDCGSNRDYRTDSLGHQSGTFDIAQVKLEKGSVSTEFEPKTIQEEMSACQRYYRILGDGVCGIFKTSTSIEMQHAFEIPMRKVPSYILLTSSPYILETGVSWRTGSGSTVNYFNAGVKGVKGVGITGFTGGTVQHRVVFASDVIGLDAE